MSIECGFCGFTVFFVKTKFKEEFFHRRRYLHVSPVRRFDYVTRIQRRNNDFDFKYFWWKTKKKQKSRKNKKHKKVWTNSQRNNSDSDIQMALSRYIRQKQTLFEVPKYFPGKNTFFEVQMRFSNLMATLQECLSTFHIYKINNYCPKTNLNFSHCTNVGVQEFHIKVIIFMY